MDLVMLSSKVKVKGVNSLLIYYYADADKTIEVELYDSNGVSMSGGTPTSINVVAGFNDISQAVNDYISANESTLATGIYILRIGSDYHPIILAEGAQNPDQLNGVPPTKIQVIHIGTGLSITLPPETIYIPLNGTSLEWIVLQYWYDKVAGKGRIMTPSQDTLVKIDTGWATHALVTLTLKFQTLTDLAHFLMRISSIRDSTQFKLIAQMIQNNDLQNAINLLYFHGVKSIMGGYPIGYKIDNAGIQFTIEELIPLGFFDVTNSSFLKYIATSAGLGAIIAGLAVGGPIGIVIAGLGALITGYIAYKSLNLDTKDTYEAFISRANYWESQLKVQYSKTMQTAQYVCTNYGLTDQDCQNLKNDITELYDIGIQAIEDLKNLATNWYEAGYNRARTKWGLIGGISGVIAERILRKKRI